MNPHANHEWEPVQSKIHEHLKDSFGISDTSGLELFVLLQRTAHMIRLFDTQPTDDIDISGPRWRLLLSLYIHEKIGDSDSLTPTAISHTQRVSKNTISVLLRGLETQGLIQRTLDSADLRTFRIQLTPAGREYVQQTVPDHIENLNRLLSGFKSEEKAQLTTLLAKLQRSLMELCKPDCNKEEPISEE